MSAPSPAANSHAQLLAVLADFDDEEETEYRFLVDGLHVKYVTVDPGVLPKDDRTFAPVLIPLLPPFPPGDWNEGRIAKDPQTGRPFFASTKKSELPGVKNTWHQTVIDHIELKRQERLRQNVHVATHPLFEKAVVYKCAEFPWQIGYLEAETTAYQWIHGRGVGPEFLGHVAEEGRVIGFVVEHVEGAQTATPADLAACRRALARLHTLGIRHGDINKHNFLVRGDGEAVMIDFEAAERGRTGEELEAEYGRLEESLNDTSGRGGVGVGTSC